MLYHVRFFCLTIAILLPSTAFASFYSQIFQEREDGLHVVLRGVDKQGKEWATRVMTEADKPFLKTLYSDPDNLKLYGDGKCQSEEQIQEKILRSKNCSSKRLPVGGWIIEDTSDHSSLGVCYLMADELVAGQAEIARLLLPSAQGSGLGSSIIQAIVKIWAPSVKIMGKRDEKYRCFGGIGLEKLYVSSSPENIASRMSQLHAGFISIIPEVSIPVIDMRGLCTSHEELSILLENLYKPNNTNEPLIPDRLYRVRDHEDAYWTFSLRSKLDKIRFHFIYEIKI